MFARRLVLSIGFLALLFCGQGALSWWVTRDAEERVLHGRIAADLVSGFQELTANKQRLRAWALQALLGARPSPRDADLLSGELIATTDRLVALGVLAERLEREGGETSPHHGQRTEALDLLGGAFATLRASVLKIDPAQAPSDPVAAWAALASLFDVAGEKDLRSVLDASIRRESDAIERKRREADASLRHVKLIALATNALLVITALLLAAWLAMSLRRPLADVMNGADALERGDLRYRMTENDGDEFGQFARRFNTMASELQQRRQQETLSRRQLEELVSEKTAELQTALADLQNSESRRRQLLSEVSHELRTPTTAIRGEAEVALRGPEKPAAQYRETIERIGAASIQLGNVINDLLTLARSDVDALSIKPRPVDLVQAAARAVQQAGGNAALRDVEIATDIGAERAVVMGDMARLQQLIGLILDNAIRYSHQGGLVRMSLEMAHAQAQGEAPEQVRLTIGDRGIGIAPDDRPLVFERHFRAADARRHRADGTGLGLAIAAVLAGLHHASIDIESEPGHGTKVTLAFPLAPVPVMESA